jgi:hypothetical protein
MSTLLPAGFLLYQLPRFPWFADTKGNLASFSVATLTGTDPFVDELYSWSSPPCKQLPRAVLRQRACIAWDVPKADLQKQIGQKEELLYSPTIYFAGTGVQLFLSHDEDDSDQLGLFVQLQRYELQGRQLTSLPSFLSCTYATSRMAPGQAEPVPMFSGTETLTSYQGWGERKNIPASSPSDLEPYLVEGHLKLRLVIEEVIEMLL